MRFIDHFENSLIDNIEDLTFENIIILYDMHTKFPGIDLKNTIGKANKRLLDLHNKDDLEDKKIDLLLAVSKYAQASHNKIDKDFVNFLINLSESIYHINDKNKSYYCTALADVTDSIPSHMIDTFKTAVENDTNYNLSTFRILKGLTFLDPNFNIDELLPEMSSIVKDMIEIHDSYTLYLLVDALSNTKCPDVFRNFIDALVLEISSGILKFEAGKK